MRIKILCFLSFAVLVFSCKHESTIKDEPELETEPSGLTFATDSILISEGETYTTGIPEIEGTEPIVFSIVNNPSTDNIVIDSDGRITFQSTLAADIYRIDVQASNSVGTITFSGAFTLNVIANNIPPADLMYAQDTLFVKTGSIGSTNQPTITGSIPLSFNLTTSPDAGGSITINSDGVILTDTALVVGNYSVSVTASNSVGSETFTNVMVVTVVDEPFISFATDIQPIMQMKCANCHTSGPQTIYTDYNNSVRDIVIILDRIQRPEGSGGYMPKNAAPLTPAEIQLIKDWQTDGFQD